MTIVRRIDDDGDWTFGQGKSNYISKSPAIIQSINTRLMEFLGDCYFNQAAGIDWFSHLGSKDKAALNLSVSAIIVNTENVTGILQLTVTLNAARLLSISYSAETVYSTTVASEFIYDLNGIG